MRERLELGSDAANTPTLPLSRVADLSEVSEPEEVYEWGLDLVNHHIEADVGRVAVLSKDRLVPTVSTRDELTGREHAIPLATSIPGSVVSSGESCLIEDRQDVRGGTTVASTPDAATRADVRFRSLACAPIPGIGAIYIEASEPKRFNAENLDLLTAVGRIVGNVVGMLDGADSGTPTDPLLEEIGNMVSHDLRNKINIATGRLDLAIKTDEEEHLVQSVEALESVERIADVVVSLARTGEPLSSLEDVDLEEATEAAYGALNEPEAALVIKASATILADPDCLSQLLENLFRNAVEHSEGDVTIEVGLLEDGFYVADDGPGIPPEKRDEVRDLGYSTAAGHQGKGLSIVTRMADAHGWEIGITGSTSGGTRIDIHGVVFR